jgi:hypothetical protein
VRQGLVTSYAAYADGGLADGDYEYVVRWIDGEGHTSPDSNVATATAGPRGGVAGASACGLFGIEVAPALGLLLLARRRASVGC